MKRLILWGFGALGAFAAFVACGGDDSSSNNVESVDGEANDATTFDARSDGTGGGNELDANVSPPDAFSFDANGPFCPQHPGAAACEDFDQGMFVSPGWSPSTVAATDAGADGSVDGIGTESFPMTPAAGPRSEGLVWRVDTPAGANGATYYETRTFTLAAAGSATYGFNADFGGISRVGAVRAAVVAFEASSTPTVYLVASSAGIELANGSEATACGDLPPAGTFLTVTITLTPTLISATIGGTSCSVPSPLGSTTIKLSHGLSTAGANAPAMSIDYDDVVLVINPA